MRHECSIDVDGSPCGKPAVDFIPRFQSLRNSPGKGLPELGVLWLCAEHFDYLASAVANP
jgi:hypothetical protein